MTMEPSASRSTSFVAVVTVLFGLASASLTTGCAASLKIDSSPRGARILIDGKDSGYTTPNALRPRLLPDGRHTIQVELEGYERSPARTVKKEHSGALVFWSIVFPPALITNLIKGFSRIEPTELKYALEPHRAALNYVAPSPTPRSAPLERFSGERKQLSHRLRCAALPLQIVGVSDGMELVADDLLMGELTAAGFDPIGRDELNALVQLESQKDLLGCDDTTCAAEIGNALGVPALIAGKLAAVGGNIVITLTLIEVKRTTVRARATVMDTGTENIVPRLMASAVQQLLAGGSTTAQRPSVSAP